MNIKEAYMVLQKATIRVGAQYRVLRIPEDCECGWDNHTILFASSLSSSYQNKIGKCVSASKNGVLLMFDARYSLFFPFFVLELVEEPKPEIVFGTFQVDDDATLRAALDIDARGDLRITINANLHSFFNQMTGKLHVYPMSKDEQLHLPGLAYDADGWPIIERYTKD